jgi:hypothetical protein
MTDHTTLETRLHDAADPALWDGVSPDAWQQNQRRVAADRSRRAGRRLRAVAAAAAVVVVVGGGVLIVSQLGGSSLGPSGGGSRDQDPFGKDGRVGKTVVLERFSAGGVNVVHSAFLTRAGGKGLSLCDQYKTPDTTASSGGSGSCTASELGASKANAFVFITGSRGGDQKGVTGAVDSRTASLKAWASDSASARVVPLHALGFNGLQAFGVTTVGKQAPVVRLAAYDAGGALLQVLSPPSVFGAEWLPDDDTCTKTTVVAPPLQQRTSAGPVETVEAATSSVRISGNAGPGNLCVAAPKGEATSLQREQGWVVVVTGPEVGALRVMVGKQTTLRTPRHYPGTAWGVVVIANDHPKQSVTIDARGAGGGIAASKQLGSAQYYQAPTN